MNEPEEKDKKKKKKLSKPVIIAIVVVVIIVIAAMGSGGGQESTSGSKTQTESQGTEEVASWDANSTLFGMTVEEAWDEIEQQGYSLGKILSITGAELNNDEGIRHSSTAQTWRITKAELDGNSKSVDITVTSNEDFIDDYGEDSVKGGVIPEPEPEMTLSQENALKQADNYLSVMAFSYSGLIEQLEYEGYSNEDATFAADNCGADWNEQAAKKARQYLDTMAFSRSGLIDQLEYEGFTSEQATYGVDSVGLN